MADAELFFKLRKAYMKENVLSNGVVSHRKFKSFFGVSPSVCSFCWNKLKHRASNSKPNHLLWSLHWFLKAYNTEHINALTFNVDEKTYRKWTWDFIKHLSQLNVVCFENRFKNQHSNQKIFVSLDGVDFSIHEPKPFNKTWFSHKFHGAGIRYEVGICINSGEIVWAYGGVPCGEWPDLKLARNAYIGLVGLGEITLADKDYRDSQYFKIPANRQEKRILARHETINSRLKNFNILKQRFRHPLHHHPQIFKACINLVQISILNGEPLFNL